MKTQQAIVSDSGWEAKPVNPFKQYGDAMATDYMEFEANNPKLSLTKCRPDLSGKAVNVVQIEQLFSPTVGWVNKSEVKDITRFIRETRLAFEVVSEEESKLNKIWQEVEEKMTEIVEPFSYTPELSVEEAAERTCIYAKQRENEIAKTNFIKGANHILQSGEYVKVSDVERIVNSNWCPCNDDLCDTNIVVNNILTTLKNKQ